MPGVTVVVTQARCNEVLNGPDGAVGRYVLTLAQQAANLAKVYCPVRSGALRAGIQASVETGDGGVVGRVGDAVEYAWYVHEGTRYMTGRPFIRKACEDLGMQLGTGGGAASGGVAVGD